MDGYAMYIVGTFPSNVSRIMYNVSLYCDLTASLCPTSN